MIQYPDDVPKTVYRQRMTDIQLILKDRDPIHEKHEKSSVLIPHWKTTVKDPEHSDDIIPATFSGDFFFDR